MKTYPGGHRHLKRCDPRIKALWRLLVNHCDKESFEISYKRGPLAASLAVSTSTIDRWLNHFEKWGWIERQRRFGGRGQGNVILMTWLKRGFELHQKRKRAESYLEEKRERYEQNKRNYERSSHRQTTLKPSSRDLKNRAMKDARMTLTRLLQNQKPSIRRHAVAAFGKWAKERKPTLDVFYRLIERLRRLEKLSRPKWAKTTKDVYRWIRGLINNMLVHKNWHEKLEARFQMKRTTQILKKIERIIGEEKNCPICKQAHTHDDFEYGADEKGLTNCIGWLRLKRADYAEIWHSASKNGRKEFA